MKKLSKLTAILLTFALCLSTMSAFAGENNVVNELLSRGYPQALIDEMLEEEKYDLINDDCFYEGAVVHNYDENGDLISIKSFDENSITPYGQIKTSHLKLTITTSKSNYNTIVTFNYDWKTLPVNRYQVPICVAWDPDVFSMQFNSFRKVNLKVDNIERKLCNVESKYEDIMKYISDISDKSKIDNIPVNTENCEDE